MRERTNVRANQNGLVSLVVTMIIMIVLSLIVVGFAQLARREQRIALDHQLSDQAVYAAESGINDAKRAIFDTSPTGNVYNLAGGSNDKKECKPNASGWLSDNKLGGTDSNVFYSCLLIDQSLPELRYGDVQTDNSTVVPINAVDPSTGSAAQLTQLTINWETREKTPTTPVMDFATEGLPKASSWPNDKTGILRVDITDPGNYSRTNLLNNLYTAFLYPGNNTTAPTTTYTPNGTNLTASGEIVQVDCSKVATLPYQCHATIQLPGTSSTYYLRLKSLYTASQVQITGTSASGKVDFKGAQVEIDSTGKAADVLKRLRVRTKAPDNSTQQSFAEYALDVPGGICKQLETMPGITKDNCAYSGPLVK